MGLFCQIQTPSVVTLVPASVLLLAVCSMAVGADSPKESSQLILSDSFEDGVEAPTGWREGNAVESVEYAWSEGVASEGKRSLCLKKTAARFFPISQWSHNLPHRGDGACIEVSVMARAIDATKATVDVQFRDEAGHPLGHEWIAYIGPKEEAQGTVSHEWGRYAAVVKIPQGTKELVFALQIYGPGSVWFDEFEARYVAVPGDGAPSDGGPHRDTSPSGIESGAEANLSANAIEIKVKGEATGQYLFSPPAAGPAGLVVVLPGGDGSAEFNPFVNNIARMALEGKYAVAQPIAPKWRPNQAVTWPTLRNRAPGMKYATEELVGKVIADVAAKHEIDRQRIFLLAWSSGGPAAYAIALHEKSPVAGSLIAMSVFKPQQLPPLKSSAKRRFYLLHSPDDQVCPFWMAQQAEVDLKKAGAHVMLAPCDGGHGWNGDVFGNIRAGFEWLESATPQDEGGR